MLDVFALNKDAGIVELAGRLEVLGGVRFDQRVQGAGSVAGGLGIGMSFVIEKLVLVANRSSPVVAIEHARPRFAEPFLNEIDNTRIAARRDSPLEAEIEICELFSRENFATAGLGPASAFGILQATVLDDPAFARF